MSLPTSLRGSIGHASLQLRAHEVIRKLDDAIAKGKVINEEGNIEGERAQIIHVVRPQTELDELEVRIKEYKDKVVGSPEEIRTYVVNRLVQETHTSKASDRLKALELIGKIGEIGLFSESKTARTSHGNTEELEKMLRKKIANIIELDKDEFAAEEGSK